MWQPPSCYSKPLLAKQKKHRELRQRFHYIEILPVAGAQIETLCFHVCLRRTKHINMFVGKPLFFITPSLRVLFDGFSSLFPVGPPLAV
jgi:hypothetical protein